MIVNNLNDSNPIAVVGMAGVFPGACDLAEFWQNILNKEDACRNISEDRWISGPEEMVSPEALPDKAFHSRGCMIHDFKFNPDGFKLPADLLNSLDPLYHLILHAGRNAFSSIESSPIDKDRISVFLAAIALPTDSSSRLALDILGQAFENALFQEDRPLSISKNDCLASQVTALPSILLARALGFSGSAFTLDAACASSIYAVKLACDALDDYRSDAALAGGVSRPDSLYTQTGFSQLRALSPSGRCSPFDSCADGLIVGEGAGILVLRRLKDALKDGNEILGIIRGIGISNDMRGNLLAPDSEGQLRAMKAAYESAGWKPSDVDIIECHGAGTPVGDATELQSLEMLWKDAGSIQGFCPIGSVKSMIGHLLTAAGAAGIIKILLALKHKTLPPSLNFTSPSRDTRFRVQTEAQSWKRRTPHIPRRAAVSAFGFGGINGHILLEEWDQDSPRVSTFPGEEKPLKGKPLDIAVVGMDAFFGSLKTLRDFQEALMSGKTCIRKRPPLRWKGCDKIADSILGFSDLHGGYIEDIELDLKDLHIPPNEIKDILVQHLIMVKVASRAMCDAGYTSRKHSPRMGAVIGIGFDMEATDFHVRWSINSKYENWLKKAGIFLNDYEKRQWQKSLKNEAGQPLTAPRTLGALAGIIASRVAREFGLGAPSFTVSGNAVSGLNALEMASRLIQKNEADVMLAGSVDMACDIRNIVMTHKIRPFSASKAVRPFDRSADGTLPGEGAAALVLKRLDLALSDGNRIYGVIKGIGSSVSKSHDGLETGSYMKSLQQGLDEAGISLSSLSFFEAHGSAHPDEDKLEAISLNKALGNESSCIAIGSLKPITGHAGSASGLASVIKTCLCLYNEIIPPIVNFTRPEEGIWHGKNFHFPAFPHYWARNRKDGPRRACCAAFSAEGSYSHVVLEGHEPLSLVKNSYLYADERKRPLGIQSSGLFIAEGKDRASLVQKLSTLKHHIDPNEPIEHLARSWSFRNPFDSNNQFAISIIADHHEQLEALISEATNAVLSESQKRINGRSGIIYQPGIKVSGDLALVFPGSGNHFVGMGRTIGGTWPEILRKMDSETLELMTQLIPGAYVPFRQSWTNGWEKEAMNAVSEDPLIPIFGQVVFGSIMTELVSSFGIKPNAVIGYSLGETAGLFAMRAWPDRGEMLLRLRKSPLFQTELAGNCNSARKAWSISQTDKLIWKVASVNRPAEAIREVLPVFPLSRLLIVNTPEECVIGGNQKDVEGIIDSLKCEAVFLDGVVTVHCDAAIPVKEAYRELHLFPTVQPEGIRFYSSALGCAYELNDQSAADSITMQAVSGFDFTSCINQAYEDGLRIFLEIGPHSSCTRMIKSILGQRPHLAISASSRSEDEFISVLKMLGNLAAHRISIDTGALYSKIDFRKPVHYEGHQIIRIAGGNPFHPEFPEVFKPDDSKKQTVSEDFFIQSSRAFLETLAANSEASAEAHKNFLLFSDEMMKNYSNGFALQAKLIEQRLKNLRKSGTNADDLSTKNKKHESHDIHPPARPLDKISETAYSRSLCLEFAIGSAGIVLGAQFADVDTYPARVRLPDEPLMLVDRIISVEGEKDSLGPGKVITEHDVLPEAWYLDGGRAPVCISVEAGQADLFLCSYLGIDHRVKGQRTYRLLDATVQFHRGLPVPGDVIRYEIEIDKFVRQAETWLFFFHFRGFIGKELLITMKNGCAGFFTEKEVENSGGIILTEQELEPLPGKIPSDWNYLVPMGIESYSEKQIRALRNGDLSGCFGEKFKGILLSESLLLPDGRMNLIDRVLTIDPKGGRYGLGMIAAQSDIHPDDWFLTCHFVDDPVMPGTLMYECCAHALRVFIQRLGWVSDKPDACYEPIPGVESILKCRGPVTPKTSQVVYKIEIKELGYMPEPYVIADAHMFADSHYIVMFRDISIKITGVSRNEIETLWQTRNMTGKDGFLQTITANKKELFSKTQILALAVGKPSDAFGDVFRPFDEDRFLARLPGPPFMFLDRIVKTEPAAFVLKPDGWIEAEYDMSDSDWYFSADRSEIMPFAVLLEIGLQPCGWLAAYAGSALTSKNGLRFRNLGGTGFIHRDLLPERQTLTMRSRITQVSSASDMIIESFDFQVSSRNEMIYEGKTTFGFFTESALSQQKGLKRNFNFAENQEAAFSDYLLEDVPPFSPDESIPWRDPGSDPGKSLPDLLAMPARAIRMIDRIEKYYPSGGNNGLGYIKGSKIINPEEWFFKAHFHQDPVWPGSLGIEAFIQLLKFIVLDKWPQFASDYKFCLVTGLEHSWTYRGQVTQKNHKVEVEAMITKQENFLIMADGFLSVDGLVIYEMKNFGIKIVPKNKNIEDSNVI